MSERDMVDSEGFDWDAESWSSIVPPKLIASPDECDPRPVTRAEFAVLEKTIERIIGVQEKIIELLKRTSGADHTREPQ